MPRSTVLNIQTEVDCVNGDRKKKKRGSYVLISQAEKAAVAKYASENGVTKAVQHFKDKNVKASSVRDWMHLYKKVIKEKCKVATTGEVVNIAELPEKRRGRPPALGYKLDQCLQNLICGMRSRGTPIGTSVTIAVGRAILLKHDRRALQEFGGHVDLGKEWARSFLKRMGFTKRRASSTSKVLPFNFKELQEDFLTTIKAVVEMEEVPREMIINWDQTEIKVCPSCTWTMELRGTKRVEISNMDDKRQITAVFACTCSGKFLPIQLIYQGTTHRCYPQGVLFPPDWDICCTPNHWSNEATMIKYVQNIIIPYVTETRKHLQLDCNHPALVIFDVFRGQCTEAVMKLLEENNILYVLIPPNTTDKLQPLDLSVNKPAKDFMRRKFQWWYSNIVHQQLENGTEEEVDTRLSVMKPLSAQWIIEMFNYFVTHPSIVINGFREAGITEILDQNQQ